MRVRRRLFPCVVVGALVVLAGCDGSSVMRGILHASGADDETPTFKESFRRYSGDGSYKAFVLARDSSRWAWGWAADDSTMHEALDHAFRHCEHIRVTDHVQGACRLYAVNDEVVSDYTEPALRELLARYRSVTPDDVP